MKSKMKKIIVYSVFAIAIILASINACMDYRWEKENEEFYRANEMVLAEALETGNVELCKEYQIHPTTCIALVAKKLNDPSVCEKAYKETAEIYGCKATLLGNESYCKENLSNVGEIMICEIIFMSEEELT